jgi:hypothetical protein
MLSPTPQTALPREADGRAIAWQSAERCGNADGAAGVSSDCSDSRAFLDAGCAAAGGAARQQIRVGGLQAIPEIGIFSGDTVGQGMQIGFAGDDRALHTQSFCDGGIFACDFVFVGVVAGASGGAESLEVETVLQRYGKSE